MQNILKKFLRNSLKIMHFSISSVENNSQKDDYKTDFNHLN